MDGAPVTVAVVGSRIEAELIVGLLRAHGLRAGAVTDDAGGQEPQLQLDGVRVLVPAADADAARRLLDDAAPAPGHASPLAERRRT
ncbi:putative signal transducing protein [Geodermatophilus sp. SYSU D00691]